MKFSTIYDFQFADTYSDNYSQGSNIYLFPFPNFNNPYEPLVNKFDLNSSSPFTVVASTLSNQLAVCQNLPTNYLKLSSGIPQFVQNPSAIYFNPVVRRIAEKRVFEFIRKENVNASALPNGTNFVTSEALSNHGKFLQIDSLSEKAINTSNSNLLIQAKTINSNILPSINADANQKSFNEIYLKFLMNDSLISSADIDTLRSIAGKCPYTEGTAVYQARALLSRYDTLQYYNGCEVSVPPNSGTGNRLYNTDDKEDDFIDFNESVMIYPNPAKDAVAVWAPKNSIFYLYDISGKMLICSELKGSTSKLIDIKDLSQGIYIYKILKNDKIIKTNKLVIIH